MKSLVGQVVNFRYEILEKTGEGSLFTVYRTRDKVMNRLSAVKVLKSNYSEDEEFASRLIDHARKLVPISHPNVTKVYEAEMAEDTIYIAEEHVRGIDLKERINRIAPFTIANAVDVATAITQGLDYLHRNGIIHGDLRPHKVLIGPDGEVKVSGAGLAFATGSKEESRTLALMRAAHYAAPEAFEGSMPDERSDVYSLGVIMFEMLTGNLPYTAESAIGVAMKHARDPIPSPRSINAGIPRAMEGIILKALAKNPDERYQTSRELLTDLRTVQESMRVGKPLSWSPQDPSRIAAPVEDTGSGDENLLKSLGKAALLVALVAVVVFAAFTALVRSTPPDVVVPSLIGMTLDEARQSLDDLGLTLRVAREEYNDRHPEGEIYFTDPQDGQQTKKGGTVQVYVSKGSREVRVPSVTGQSEGRARGVLLEDGFVIGDIKYEHSDTVPAGDVIAQNPRSGVSVDKSRAAVDLTVSLGPQEQVEPQPQPAVRPDPTPSDSDQGETADGQRRLRIRLAVPEGPKQRVQIIVKDESGQWTALDEEHEGGETITTTFNAVGKDVEIRTLIDGKEVNRQVR